MTETRITTTPLEALAIIAICFGWAIANSFQSLSSNLSGVEFSDASFLGLVITEFVFAGAALLLLHHRGYAIGSLFPKPTRIGCALGVLVYMAAWLASTIVSAPFSSSQPLPIQEIVNRADVSLLTLIGVAVVNGNYEEIFLLGFLVRGLNSYGPFVAVGVSLSVRVLYHLYQGPVGALSVFGFGLVLSIYYARSQALFPAIFAHVIGDILPFLWRGEP